MPGTELRRARVDRPGAVELLSDARRRLVPSVLKETEASLALANVARDVLAREDGTSLAELGHDRIRRCYTDLYHGHVPKRADAGPIEFDSARLTVAIAERGSATPPSGRESRACGGVC